MADLPEPLVSVDVDLSGFSGFLLDVDRILSSELVALGSPEECWAAMMLWCRAWKQSPPASLPDDDKVLAAFSGAGKRWPKVKQMALRGFVKCSDGRLYHKVLAEEANTAWKKRVAYQQKRQADNERLQRWRASQETQGETTNETVEETPVKRVSTQRETDPETRKKGSRSEVTGKDLHPDSTSFRQDAPETSEGRDLLPPEKPNQDLATGNTRAREAKPEPTSAAAWQAYADAHRIRYGVEPVRNAKTNAILCQLVKRLGVTEAPAVAAHYVRNNASTYVRAKHCLDLLIRDAEGLRTEWATGRAVTDTEARQADRRQSTANAFAPLLAEADAREKKRNG